MNLSGYTGWHIYGVLWTPTAITYYYDGVQVGQVTSSTTTISSYPMSIILNQAIDASSVGGPQRYPSDMMIDYVHAYSNDSGATAVTPQTNYAGPGDDATAVGSIIKNPGFEGGGESPLDALGNRYLVADGPGGAQHAARLTGEAAFEQVITGLKVNTSYNLKAWIAPSTATALRSA